MPRPYEKVWIDDLENDEALKLVSDSAWRLWVRMFMYMACKSPEYGRLLTKEGSIPTADELSRLFSEPRAKLLRCISELEKRAVFSRDVSGAITCRRQMRKSELSGIRKDASEARWKSVEHPVKNLQCKTDPICIAKGHANAGNGNGIDLKEEEIDLSEGVRGRPRTKRAPDPELVDRARRVIAIWNEATKNTPLPETPPFGELAARDKNLLARLRGKAHRDDSWWRMVFEWIARSPGENGESQSGWRTQLHWLVAKEDNLQVKFESAKKARSFQPRPPPNERGALPLVIPEKPKLAELPAGGIKRFREEG